MRKNKLIFVSILMVILVVTISACSSTKTVDSTVPAQDKNTVVIQNHRFNPDVVTIKKGETITWINQDAVGHTATGKSFDSGLLNKGQSYKYTFNEVGTFDITCTPHPDMKGTIIVQ